MCQLLIVGYQVRNVDIAVVLLDKDIFPYLVSTTSRIRKITSEKCICVPVYKGIVKPKFKDKVPQLGLDLGARVLCFIRTGGSTLKE